MLPLLFATSPTPEELAAQLKVADDYLRPLAFAFYLLAAEVVLALLWSAYRRLVPPAPDETRAPLSFVLFLVFGQVLVVWGWGPLRESWEKVDRIVRADIVVVFHLGFVILVLVYQLVILIGWPLGWRIIRVFWLRLGHLLGITFVTGQAALGMVCPLTTWEDDLRGDSWKSLEGASSLGKWCNEWLFAFTDAGNFTDFAWAYGAFALLIVLGWALVRPNWPGCYSSGERPGS